MSVSDVARFAQILHAASPMVAAAFTPESDRYLDKGDLSWDEHGAWSDVNCRYSDHINSNTTELLAAIAVEEIFAARSNALGQVSSICVARDKDSQAAGVDLFVYFEERNTPVEVTVKRPLRRDDRGGVLTVNTAYKICEERPSLLAISCVESDWPGSVFLMPRACFVDAFMTKKFVHIGNQVVVDFEKMSIPGLVYRYNHSNQTVTCL